MRWRLGLDIGTNSLGWASITLEQTGAEDTPPAVLDTGVRLFSDGRNPKDGQSLATMRRLPRQQRKRRDRYLKRRDEFMERLIRFGLMPTDRTARKALENLDPWALRVRGLEEALTPHEFGRALFHLQQRRGFKSNRKTDRGADSDSGKIKPAAERAQAEMAARGARTIGEWLARERVSDPKSAHEHPVRARLHGSGAKAYYDFYPTRAMIEAEFDRLWEAQSTLTPAILTEEARAALRDTLSYQRELKPQPVGRCTLNPDQQRAPKALPSVQRLRILQELNHLGIQRLGQPLRSLTLAERDILLKIALGTAKLTFERAGRKLGLGADERFNLESEKRKHLDGDLTAARLAKPWGKAWRDLPLATQDEIVERLLAEENESDLTDWLCERHGLTPDQAAAVAAMPLPDGHGALGRTAVAALLPALESAVIPYSDAVAHAGYESHSDLDRFEQTGGRLPYYGAVLERHVAFGSGEPDEPEEKRLGKIANPTVHVALNQVRRVVNDLIDRFGPPAEIVVELARDLPLSAKAKSELKRDQRVNQDRNDVRRAELARQGIADSYENRLRLRLWEDLNPDNPLDRRCPYTGEQIGVRRLFTDEVEIDHILPFSRTLDDSAGNKTVSLRRANRDKGKKTPYEAFADTPAGYDWDAILERAAGLPGNKSWRFGPDAMERYENEERDFLARQLNDTRYISRLMRTYLRATGADVWVTPGRLTADLRWAWGLDALLLDHNTAEAGTQAKNRNDHRHHAIDAAVVAVTDRGLLNAVARAAARAEDQLDRRLLADLPEPWPGFREELASTVRRVVVSHKPDHGVQAALHNDTAYGIVAENADGTSEVVHRVPLGNLTKPDQLAAIRDDHLRALFVKATEGLNGKDFTAALLEAGAATVPPTRKVRVRETLSVVKIPDAKGRPYKAYKRDGNYCYDIFADRKGRWTGAVVSSFDANRPDFEPRSRTRADGTPLIMRLRIDDMLTIEEGGEKRVMRVVKMSKGQIVLAEHFEGGSLKARDKDEADPFKYMTVAPSRLQTLGATLVRVSPSGVSHPTGR